MSIAVIHCTCPDATSAGRIAEALVESRLAACVQVVPGLRSTYRWDGRIAQADEVLLLIKTAVSRVAEVFERIGPLHPHDVPELIAFDVREASRAYAAWVLAETRDDG